MTPPDIVGAIEDAEIGCRSCVCLTFKYHFRSGMNIPVCDAGRSEFPIGGKGICSLYKPKTKGRRRVA